MELGYEHAFNDCSLKVYVNDKSHAFAVAEFVREVVRRDELFLNMLLEEMLTELIHLKSGKWPFSIVVEQPDLNITPRGSMTRDELQEYGL